MVKVKDVMKKFVYTVDPEISVDAAARIMTNNRIGSIIVVDKGKPVGIVTDSDIVTVVAKGDDPKKVKLKSLEQRKFITASPEEDLMKVIRTMVKTGVKRMPVIKDGQLLGIVSDKEIMITAPEMIDILSEKLKARVSMVALPHQTISGICELCEGYSDELKNVSGKWACEDCRGD
ncbi:MAG: CBS domain-containing protein [Candidatus Aenigmarchaeota archaeon]|nr:CBS domain-containing protein [Candidatus Aenigmarchaeota archaeon]